MTGISAQGLVLAVGDGASPEVFTQLANLTEYSGPSSENPEIEVTDLSSVAKQFVAGLVDNGEVSASINYDPDAATHVTLLSDLDSGAIKNWRVTWPDVSPSKTWTFPAFVKSFSPTASVDAALTGDLTLRLTGIVTRT